MSMNIDEKIEVMQAFKDGKEIECCLDVFGGVSWEVVAPSWNFDTCDYRVKQSEEMTFDQAITFIKEHPEYEIMTEGDTVFVGYGLYYREGQRLAFGFKIEDLQWRETRNDCWKKFII